MRTWKEFLEDKNADQLLQNRPDLLVPPNSKDPNAIKKAQDVVKLSKQKNIDMPTAARALNTSRNAGIQ